jgi:hypothetical protein
MALIALRSLESYAGAPWWAMMLIVLVALVAEISIYSTTLHEPIHDWIREPKLARERDESRRSGELSYDKGYNHGYEDGRDGKSSNPIARRREF